MLNLRKAEERGAADHGWLQSFHTFSFANYHDPRERGFSDLLVINDDRIAPNKGFGRHPHEDMEIFTYVLEGQLEHRDSMGNGSVIEPGDVQMMSAGTGVSHSEFNPSGSHTVHLLQIWIVPSVAGAQPDYQQQRFTPEEKRGRLRLIISPDGAQDSLRIRQDARVYAGLFDGAETAALDLDEHRYAYVHVARGNVALNGVPLKAGDGVRVRHERQLAFTDGQDAEVLVFDLRPQEIPTRPTAYSL